MGYVATRADLLAAHCHIGRRDPGVMVLTRIIGAKDMADARVRTCTAPLLA